MRVTVRLFAKARQASGREVCQLDLPPEATVADAEAMLRQVLAAPAEALEHVAFARNHQYVRRDAPLADGDELAVLPPVSGG